MLVEHVVNVRLVCEQVGNDQLHHGRVPTVVLAQIKDQRICISNKVEGRCDRGSADIRVLERIQLQVADVSLKTFGFVECTVSIERFLPEAVLLLDGWRCWAVPCSFAWLYEWAIHDEEVLVLSVFPKLLCERLGKVVAVRQRVKLPRLLVEKTSCSFRSAATYSMCREVKSDPLSV